MVRMTETRLLLWRKLDPAASLLAYDYVETGIAYVNKPVVYWDKLAPCTSVGHFFWAQSLENLLMLFVHSLFERCV
jgi:hypothetical protein